MTVVVQSSSSAAVNGTALEITKPTGTVNGDLLIAHLGSNATTSYGSLAGWTEIKKDTQINISGITLWKIASSEGASFTFTMSLNGRNLGTVWRIDGHNPTTPINGSTILASSGTAVTCGAITPTVANCLFLLMTASRGAITGSGYAMTTSDPGGWAEDSDFSSGTDLSSANAHSAVRPQTTSTGDATFTLSGNQTWVSQFIAIAPVSSPANLKTYNTNALANIKTINTNVIANVKTLNTNA